MNPSRRIHWLLPLLLVLLIGLTLLLRTWNLNETPPGLWWDEATQGIDAWDLLHGQFRVFFPRAEGKEPLYVYLTTPLVAAWNGQPFAVRLAGGLLGALMVPALYITARSLWRFDPRAGVWAGLTAAAFWAVNYWPQSINRIGFQVNAFPVFMTLAVATWLNWAFGRPTRRRALVFGLLAGLTLATYLAARFSPLLWVILFLALPAERRRALGSTLPWALLGFAATAVPLVVYFLVNPQDIGGRADVFPLLRGDFTGGAFWDALWFNFKMVVGGFLGWAGDPVLRHNIPNRPAFSPMLAALTAFGIGAAVLSLRRRVDPRGWTLLSWLVVLALPSVLSLASNPHFPRLFGALPAALLLAAWPVASLGSFVASRNNVWLRNAVALGLVLLLFVEAIRTVQAYFVTWRQMDLYESFQLDISSLVETIQATPDALAVAPVTSDAGNVLEYRLRDKPVFQVQVEEATIERLLTQRLNGASGQEVIVPIWNAGPQAVADPKRIVPFYLRREGRLLAEDPRRYFDILTYQLGDQPTFDAVGNRVDLAVPFSPDVQLVGARWGAAYPNPDRDSDSAAAGSSYWVILDWQLAQPLTTLRASINVVDSAGHRLSTSDEQLLPLETLPEEWPTDSIVHTYHLVEVPATQLPGTVRLETRLYDSDTLVPLRPAQATAQGGVLVGEANVTQPMPSPNVETAQPARAVHVVLPGEITLLGADEWAQEVAPGLPLTLRLYWQAATPLPVDQTFRVSVGDTGISTTIRLPADMPVGTPMHTDVDLLLPPDVQPGTYPLSLRPEEATGPIVPLGEVNVQGRPHQFEAPSSLVPWPATFWDPQTVEQGAGLVKLLGTLERLDSPETAGQVRVAPGQPITFTLVWQAGSRTNADLVRFVHLFGDDEGPPIAQNDSAPCAGACPARSWLPGEILLDTVQLTVAPDLAPGTYHLSIGWYDAATLSRLATGDDDTRQVQPADKVILPLEVVVVR